MIVQGIEILDNDWTSIITEVDNILSQFEDFTSSTYQLRGLKSVDNKLILLKPKQTHFCEVLNYDWKDIEIKNNDKE